MSDTIKCSCSHCGAKYRLPVEAQGRTAKCKRCGNKFDVPRQNSLEDSILTWLSAPNEDDVEDAAPAKPRVISMPTDDAASEESVRKLRGPIRLRSGAAQEETGS